MTHRKARQKYMTPEEAQAKFLCTVLAFVRFIIGESRKGVISADVQELYNFSGLSFRLETGAVQRMQIWFHPDRLYTDIPTPILVLDASWTKSIEEPDSLFLENSSWRAMMLRTIRRWRSILNRIEGFTKRSPRCDGEQELCEPEVSVPKALEKIGWITV